MTTKAKPATIDCQQRRRILAVVLEHEPINAAELAMRLRKSTRSPHKMRGMRQSTTTVEARAMMIELVRIGHLAWTAYPGDVQITDAGRALLRPTA